MFRNSALKLENKDWKKEYEQRKLIVESTIHAHTIEIFNSIQNKYILTDFLVIKDGLYSYFEFNDKSLPKFDFVIADLFLYIIVGDPRSGSLEQANSCGFSQKEWKEEQSRLETIKLLIPKLTQPQNTKPLKLIILTWDDAITQQTIYSKILEALSS
jgi:hypothetical protein